MSYSADEVQICYVALMRCASDFSVSEKVGIATDDKTKAELSGAFTGETRALAARIEKTRALDLNAMDAN